jgi:hypothetical protein
VGHAADTEEIRNYTQILFRKSEGNKNLGRLNRRWEGKSKLYHKGTECRCKDRIYLIQSRVQCRAFVTTAVNLQVS